MTLPSHILYAYRLDLDAEAHKSMEAILATLTTLTRIDYDVVSFGLPRVLPTLITVHFVPLVCP